MITEKLVNIYPTRPIALKPLITTNCLSAKMSIGDIRYCLLSMAKVDEILPDKSVVRLNLNNYDKDNTVKPEKKEVKEEKPVIQNIKPDAAVNNKKQDSPVQTDANKQSTNTQQAAPDNSKKVQSSPIDLQKK